MYYKITDKNSEVYQKLHALRANEKQLHEQNLSLIAEKTFNAKWSIYFGDNSQQHFTRVPRFQGFAFNEPEWLPAGVWIAENRNGKTIFFPNKRTKAGRKMHQFLLNGLHKSWYLDVFRILGFPDPCGRFVFPFVEVVGEVILLYLGEDHEPKMEEIVEITKKEFEEFINKARQLKAAAIK